MRFGKPITSLIREKLRLVRCLPYFTSCPAKCFLLYFLDLIKKVCVFDEFLIKKTEKSVVCLFHNFSGLFNIKDAKKATKTVVFRCLQSLWGQYIPQILLTNHYFHYTILYENFQAFSSLTVYFFNDAFKCF